MEGAIDPGEVPEYVTVKHELDGKPKADIAVARGRTEDGVKYQLEGRGRAVDVPGDIATDGKSPVSDYIEEQLEPSEGKDWSHPDLEPL